MECIANADDAQSDRWRRSEEELRRSAYFFFGMISSRRLRLGCDTPTTGWEIFKLQKKRRMVLLSSETTYMCVYATRRGIHVYPTAGAVRVGLGAFPTLSSKICSNSFHSPTVSCPPFARKSPVLVSGTSLVPSNEEPTKR